MPKLKIESLQEVADAALDSCNTDIGRYALSLCLANLDRLTPKSSEDRIEKVNATAKAWLTSALKAESQGDSRQIRQLAEAMAKMQAPDDGLDDVH